jgi:hypothetical protein
MTMKDESSRLSLPTGTKSGEVTNHNTSTDCDSWRPVRLNSDGSTEKLYSQITWFLFVSLPLLMLIL